MNKLLKVAIFGGGRMALNHATAIRLQPDTKLVAVADPFLPTDEVKSKFGADVEHYKDPVELLTKARPDVVHIVTPPGTHFDLAIKCLENGASIYVEKPFALTEADATRILDLAESKGLKAAAAHQVLFQRAGQKYQTYLPMLGKIIHVESYFSFKPVRRRPDGGAPLSAEDQLIDILPHPTYLMLSALETTGAKPELTALDVDADGEVRAVIRCGSALATLIVSLRARPVESYLRVVGTNGSVTADFILGDVVALPGAGASGPAVVVKPFSESFKKFWGSFAGLCRILFRRQKSYPGLGELLTLLYGAVRDGAPPMKREHILTTVRLCEQISEKLYEAGRQRDVVARTALDAAAAQLPAIDPARGTVFLTGGSGFLGRCALREFRNRGWRVRALVRRTPAAVNQVPGIDYVEGDLGRGIAPSLLQGCDVVAHLAAETAGNQAAHQRNSIDATRNLIDAMKAVGVRKLINISSVAVLKPGPRVLREDSPIDRGNLGRGPYVWAKAEAEANAIERAKAGDIEVRTIRLGPLVDFEDYTPPGRLGREVVRLFVAMGRRGSELSVCDIRTASAVIRNYAENFESAPPMLNLLEVPATTRGALADKLRGTRPDLKFFWMPFFVLRGLSWLAIGLQKLLKPGRPALNLYAAFKAERYDPTIAEKTIAAAKAAAISSKS